MAGNTVKNMITNFGKPDKFEGHAFRRWYKKMHFLLTTLKVVYVLTTPMLKLLEDATVEAIRIRAKWQNDDYICRGHILNVHGRGCVEYEVPGELLVGCGYGGFCGYGGGGGRIHDDSFCNEDSVEDSS
ncbi:hypothetical protein Tco_1394071 [Tanacetum coccineum]